MTGYCCLNSGIQSVSNVSLVFRFAYNLFDVDVNAAEIRGSRLHFSRVPIQSYGCQVHTMWRIYRGLIELKQSILLQFDLTMYPNTTIKLANFYTQNRDL